MFVDFFSGKEDAEDVCCNRSSVLLHLKLNIFKRYIPVTLLIS